MVPWVPDIEDNVRFHGTSVAEFEQFLILGTVRSDVLFGGPEPTRRRARRGRNLVTFAGNRPIRHGGTLTARQGFTTSQHQLLMITIFSNNGGGCMLCHADCNIDCEPIVRLSSRQAPSRLA